MAGIGKLRPQLKKSGKTFPHNVDQAPACFMINLRPYSMGDNVPDIAAEYIYLPMPIQGLDDNFHIGYTAEKMGAIGGIGASIGQAIRDPSSIVGNVLSGLAGIGKSVAGAGAAALGDVVGQGKVAEQAVDLASGFINNPNYAVLFEGVEPRKFTFSWRLLPKSFDESNELINIINSLKKSALPSRLAGGNFALNYPSIAHLAVIGPQSSKMLTFSDNGAFITDINVRYDGAGHATFFKGSNHPAQIDLTLSFHERGIITSEDIGGADFYV